MECEKIIAVAVYSAEFAEAPPRPPGREHLCNSASRKYCTYFGYLTHNHQLHGCSRSYQPTKIIFRYYKTFFTWTIKSDQEKNREYRSEESLYEITEMCQFLNVSQGCKYYTFNTLNPTRKKILFT